MALQFLSRLAGTFNSYFKITTLRLKNSSGDLHVRNTGDTAFVGHASLYEQLTQYQQLTEWAVSGNPASDNVWLYAEDFNGFTVVKQRFSDGTTIVVGTGRWAIGRSGSSITKGDVVRFNFTSNAATTLPFVSLFDADSFAAANAVAGLALDTVAINTPLRIGMEGYFIVDTTAFTDGQAMYGNTTTGTWTTTEPSYPSVSQRFGVVVIGGSASGLVYLFPPQPIGNNSRSVASTFQIGGSSSGSTIEFWSNSGSNRGRLQWIPTAAPRTQNLQDLDGIVALFINSLLHPPVVAVATANVTVSSAPSSIDGITLSNGDRVLLTGQSTGSQNGLWLFASAATPLTRPTDYVAASALYAARGIVIYSTGGTVYSGSWWYLTTTGTITIDTTSTAWSLMIGDFSALAMSIGGFRGSMTHAITAARTWTFPDKSGTVAMTSDLPTSIPLALSTALAIPDGTNSFLVECEISSGGSITGDTGKIGLI